MNNKLCDSEEVIELKRLSKKLIKLTLGAAIIAVPSIFLSVLIFQGKTKTIDIILYTILLIFFLPEYIITLYKYNKQYEIAETKIFKEILLKLGNEEYTSGEEQEDFCNNIRGKVSKFPIIDIKYILRLKKEYKKFDFFCYCIERNTIFATKNNNYIAMAFEISEKDNKEEYEKIILEKNDDLNCSLKLIDNTIIISALKKDEIDIIEEPNNVVINFFIQIIQEISDKPQLKNREE